MLIPSATWQSHLASPANMNYSFEKKKILWERLHQQATPTLLRSVKDKSATQVTSWTSLIYTRELGEICKISTNLWAFLNKRPAGGSPWLSGSRCLRLCAIHPMSTSCMLAPLNLTTAGQFTLVPLTPSDVTALFKPLCSYTAGAVCVELFSHDPERSAPYGLCMFS